MKLRVMFNAFVLSALYAATAQAFPGIPGQVKEALKDDPGSKKFLETLDGLKSKCDVCHKPGADKKAKGHGLNDFGKVYHDRFEAKKYKTATEEKKVDEALKLMKAAWDKSVTEKNADGKVFGDLIKEGKLPGKND